MTNENVIAAAIVARLSATTVGGNPLLPALARRVYPITQTVLPADRPAAFVLRGETRRLIAEEAGDETIFEFDLLVLALIASTTENADDELNKIEENVVRCLDNAGAEVGANFLEHRGHRPFTAQNIPIEGSTAIAFLVGFSRNRNIPTTVIP